MPLHMIKLCVGATSIADLEGWVRDRLDEQVARGQAPEQVHTTRMTPKRLDELLDGGSLYWVIQGEIAVRQPLRAVRPFTDGEGIGRCHLVLDPAMVPVEPRPRRPFQGWRYLVAEEAPPDLDASRTGIGAMPDVLRRALRDLGLL